MKKIFTTLSLVMISGSVQAYTCNCNYTYYQNTFNVPISVSSSTSCFNNTRFQNDCYADADDYGVTAVCYDRETGRVGSSTSTISGAVLGHGTCSVQ